MRVLRKGFEIRLTKADLEIVLGQWFNQSLPYDSKHKDRKIVIESMSSDRKYCIHFSVHLNPLA